LQAPLTNTRQQAFDLVVPSVCSCAAPSDDNAEGLSEQEARYGVAKLLNLFQKWDGARQDRKSSQKDLERMFSALTMDPEVQALLAKS